jgi:hypothetical protein
MAQRIPRDESLSRVHGVGALFSAAYGNVGSSIYYALGVTAAFALGLTPVAFAITGLIFVCTAATYAEATVMFPEAGGSSSFARHAFNELVSFVAAWGQMLNYTITAAISAYFIPHYLAVFWSWLGDSPGDIIGGAVVIAGLALINIRGTEESAKLNLVLAVADLATQVVLVGIGLALVLSPQILIDNIHLGVAPSWSDFALGIAVGMIAYTGIETISNMAEEAKDAARTIPRSVGLVVMALNPRTLVVGLGWMALGIAIYVLYRRNQRLPLTETVKVVLPEPLGVEEVEYRSILVAFEDDGSFSPEMVATAVRLASKRRRGIHIHSMMTVPTNLPLNAEMPEQEAEAQSKIEEAKLIGGQRVTGHVSRVRPGQAGYTVAEEAAEIKAGAIVIGLRYRNGVPLYDKTLQTILGERPCRVIVVSDPTDKPAAVPGPALAEVTR